MRRRIGALWAAALCSSSLIILASPQPAAASELCAGSSALEVGAPGLFHPGIGTTTTTSGTGGASVTVHALPKLLPFILVPSTVGICALGPFSVSAGGLVSGWCGHSWGAGVTNNGFRFTWVSVGRIVTYVGGVVGRAVIFENVLAGQSCFTGAKSFLTAGTIEFVHCSFFKNKLDTLVLSVPDPLFHTLVPVGSTSVHLTVAGGNYHVWHKLCIGIL
ncbi:MAG TPA: hypothetical protein VHF47_03540 [Acidimicrobiales bacterium]|nr:hypothetical protein [Acidimicrobiales bacterium]